MSQIPGLNLLPVDEIPSDRSKILKGILGDGGMPESHKHGNCRRVSVFKKLEIIQEGSFGAIYKAEDTDYNRIVTLQRHDVSLDFETGIPQLMMNQLNILKTFKHDNIIHCYYTVVGRKLDSNYFVLEYCPFSLKDLLDRNTSFALYEQPVIKCIAKQLLQGLQYIHMRMVVHRDIIPQNIWFTETGVLKISGFSSACCQLRFRLESSSKEIRYWAPELLLESKDFESPVDIWAFGCILAELLLQKPIFKGNDNVAVLVTIIELLGFPTETSWPVFNKLILDLLGKEYDVKDVTEHCELRKKFAACPPLVFEIIESIFIYFPDVRASAEELLAYDYFTTAPTECSLENFATMLKDMPAVKRERSERAWEE